MPYAYDDQNVFARMLRGEIPVSPLLETPYSLAFADIHPQAPVHVLVIPKGPYVSYDHFAREASDEEIVDFTRTVGRICTDAGMTLDRNAGFRAIANAGRDGGQEVPHFHVHILGGRPLGRMLDPA